MEGSSKGKRLSVSLLNSRALGVGKKEAPDSRSIAETELAGLCVGVRERQEVCILDTCCPDLEEQPRDGRC